jgi:hypothetical protein
MLKIESSITIEMSTESRDFFDALMGLLKFYGTKMITESFSSLRRIIKRYLNVSSEIFGRDKSSKCLIPSVESGNPIESFLR